MLMTRGDLWFYNELEAMLLGYVDRNGPSRNPFRNRNYERTDLARYSQEETDHHYLHDVPLPCTVRTVDALGQPIPDVEVKLYRGRLTYYPWQPSLPIVTGQAIDGEDYEEFTTDTNGKYVLSVNPFGDLNKDIASYNHHILALLHKGTETKHKIIESSHLLKQYMRNLVKFGDGDPEERGSVLAIRTNALGQSDPSYVFSIRDGTKKVGCDTHGNLHLPLSNGLRHCCEWGKSNYDLWVKCGHSLDESPPFRIRDPNGKTIACVDSSLYLHLRAADVEEVSHPEDYDGILKISDGSGNQLACFDPSGSVVMQGLAIRPGSL